MGVICFKRILQLAYENNSSVFLFCNFFCKSKSFDVSLLFGAADFNVV